MRIKKFLCRHAPSLLLIAMFAVGLCVLLYPTVSDYVNSLHQSRVIADYTENVLRIDDARYAELLTAARAYNEVLPAGDNRFAMSDAERADYDALLDISGNGVMGYLEVPSINVKLPIYHGTGESILQAGLGHLEGTSLPVGGIGTHAVVTGHRGLPSSMLLTNLDRLDIGDVFTFTVLDELLTYEVDRILTVEPHEMDKLELVPGMDYATLITCTPYGINSHRLLVRGHRTDNLPVGFRVTADAMPIDPALASALFAVPILLGLLAGVLIRHRRRGALAERETARTW
ncbi:MAG: class C sortase [Clostridiales Family XIII bacterium]|jgi:sortase A|nr:class C sortase [Clostridiales Family XIII bacterium]